MIKTKIEEYKKDRLVVYTALFGNYDDLIEPSDKFEGCDFVCFTNQKHLKSDIWEIRIVEECHLPLNMMNRRYKFFPNEIFLDYDQSLYVDANIYIKKNPKEIADCYLTNYHLVIPKHCTRDCIYEEAKEVVKQGKAKLADVNVQVEKYQSEGFPKNFGLAANYIIFRHHHKLDVVELMKSWWQELSNYTKRDQLSLMYLVWKIGVKIKLIPENARGGVYFSLKLHKNDKAVGVLSRIVNYRREYLTNFPNGFYAKIEKKLRNK